MKRLFLNNGFRLLATGAAMSGVLSTAQAQINYTRIMVHRVGDGASSLTSRSAAVYLDEFTTATAGQSAPVRTIALPAAGAARLTESGTASSNAHITLSPNGKYLVIPGYDTDTGTASVAGSTAPRIIDTVNGNGGVGRAATASGVFASNFRCAVTDSNNNYWGSGNATGVYYFGNTAAASEITTNTYNARCLRIVNGDLYYSSASSSAGYGISKVGTGLPRTSGQTTTQIITTGTSTSTTSPYDFGFNPGMTVCYIADNRDIASGGGIQKWTNTGGTWTLAYTIGTGAGSTVGALAMTADFTGANPVIYAVTDSASNNKVLKIEDGGTLGTATVTMLASAGAGKFFRGIAFSPTASATGPSGIAQLNAASVHIYPNPAKNTLTVAADAKITSVQLHDLTGRTVVEKTGGNANTVTLPVTSLTPGIYFLRMQTSSGQLALKVQIGE